MYQDSHKTKVRTAKYGKITLLPCPDAVNQSNHKSCIPLRCWDSISSFKLYD